MAYTKTLATPRLILRPPQPADEQAIFGIHSDPSVMRYFSEPPWTDRARATRYIEENAQAFASEAHFAFSIQLAETGAVIGNCCLFAEHRTNRRAEIGYALHSAHWGKGYMSEALGALAGFAFEDRKLNRLEADIDPRNASSAALLERQGFTREGLLRERWIVGGEVSDSALYGLLQRDWEARRA